jgi:hypothetical protein
MPPQQFAQLSPQYQMNQAYMTMAGHPPQTPQIIAGAPMGYGISSHNLHPVGYFNAAPGSTSTPVPSQPFVSSSAPVSAQSAQPVSSERPRKSRRGFSDRPPDENDDGVFISVLLYSVFFILLPGLHTPIIFIITVLFLFLS